MKPKHDPGGKVRLALALDIKSSAVFGGPADCYRYRLARTWDETKPHVMFVMMNPSTADPLVDDPTVAKCGRFARAWKYGGIYVGNTFAYRATDQKRLLEVDDPVGPDNDKHLLDMARSAAVVVFAYGKPKHPPLRARGPALVSLPEPSWLQLSSPRSFWPETCWLFGSFLRYSAWQGRPRALAANSFRPICGFRASLVQPVPRELMLRLRFALPFGTRQQLK
jgi:hypothetical protein